MDKPSIMWQNLVIENGSEQKAMKNVSLMYMDKYTKGSKAGEVQYRGEPFKAGSIYCFMYVSDKRTNNRPLYLSMGGFVQNGKYIETGIDLQLVPSFFRGFILDRFQHVYNAKLIENEKLAGDGKQTKVLHFYWADAIRALGKCGWQTAATTFDRDKIKQVSVLDYSDWGAVIGIQTGAMTNVPKVYADYIKKAQNRLEKAPTWSTKTGQAEKAAEKKEAKTLTANNTKKK